MTKKEIKTIEIRFHKKHIIFAIIAFISLFMTIYIFPETFGFYEFNKIICTDDSQEILTLNNSYYCGIDIRNEGYYIKDGEYWTK